MGELEGRGGWDIGVDVLLKQKAHCAQHETRVRLTTASHTTRHPDPDPSTKSIMRPRHVPILASSPCADPQCQWPLPLDAAGTPPARSSIPSALRRQVTAVAAVAARHQCMASHTICR